MPPHAQLILIPSDVFKVLQFLTDSLKENVPPNKLIHYIK